jgi:GTPase involved in cell partitioning and DNA repair
LSQLKKQKLEAAGSSGAVQALRTENDAPVVGPDAHTANSKMFKLDIATADLKSANFQFARLPGLIVILINKRRSIKVGDIPGLRSYI